MKELSVFEMESIAGAYSWNFSSIGSAIQSVVCNAAEAVTSALLCSASYAAIGSVIGGSHGSDNGGILGVGTVGMAIGGAWGAALGAITGAVTGAMWGWDKTSALASDLMESFASGSHGIY